MMELFTQPIGIYIVALGVGFVLPLLFRSNQGLASGTFLAALVYMTMVSAVHLWQFVLGATELNIRTAGIPEPFAINLRFGLFEAAVVTAVNFTAFLGALNYLSKLKQQAGSLLIYLILVMGINGMVMTRDLFNLFIFIEITSIATYAMIGLERKGDVLVSGMKYIIATSIASAFYLLGTMFIYYLTGTLNIDDIIQNQVLIQGPIGMVALVFVFTGLLIELKPYPANGWGLDVYQTTPGSIAALISVGVSSGVLFALYKVLPLLDNMLPILIWVGGLTFLFSNIIGLKQSHAKRLLGYSSIGQIGLIVMAIAMLYQWQAEDAMLVIVGGLFINHLLAKAGLFWLADHSSDQTLSSWSKVTKNALSLVVFSLLLAALVGLPPFPGFWAKWHLVMLAGENQAWGWIAVILIGSLLEAAYLYRWYSIARGSSSQGQAQVSQTVPAGIVSLVLLFIGYWMTAQLGNSGAEILFLPLFAGFILWLFEGLNSRLKALIMILVVGLAGYQMSADLAGLEGAFAILLLGGGLLISFASLYRDDQRTGYYPILSVLLLSLMTILNAKDSLEFFYGWELMTLSSYFLISLGKSANRPSLQYLLFSLGSAYFLMTGFAINYADTGSMLLNDLGNGTHYGYAFGFLAIGFLIKIAGFGAHVWLPETYAEADDDLTALLSAVLSKASIFGLLVIGGHLTTQMTSGFGLNYVLAWLGILTALFGALMAVFQEDIKKLVAYSSMGQVGYIVTGVAIMSHMGWASALYTTVNHFMFKAILFLSVAGIIYRTGERMMYKMGGLIKNMPLTFFCSMIAIIAMSGVPPLTGFGGKWMLFNALMDKGWYWIAGLAFFSSAVGFLYMYRFLHTIYLGQRKLEHRELKEAPIWLLVPQVTLVIGILALSAYPKWILLPISDMISPFVAGQFVWQGEALVSNLGQWNAPLIMLVVGGVWMIPLIMLLLISQTIKIQKVEQFNMVFAAERPSRPEHTHYAYNFFAHYRRAIGFWVEPRATAFWTMIEEWSHSLASSLRVFYTGNGQTYALFIMIYFIAVFVIIGGLSL